MVATLALASAACATDHEYRVDAVGDATAEQSDQAAAAPASRFVVVGGNILLGAPSGRSPGAAGSPLATGIAQPGVVSAIYLTTGQSLIELDGGTQLLVDATGVLGAPVTLDPGAGQVIGLTGAPVPVVGPGALPLVNRSSPLALSPLITTISPTGAGGSRLPVPSTLPGALRPLLPTGTTGVGPVGGLCC